MEPHEYQIVVCLKAPDGSKVFRRGCLSPEQQARWEALNAANNHATMRREATKAFMCDGHLLYVIPPPETADSGESGGTRA